MTNLRITAFSTFWIVLTLCLGSSAYADNPTPMGTIEWNGTGNRFFFLQGPRDPLILNDSGDILHTLQLPGLATLLTLSPDGKSMAYVIPGEGVYVHTFLTDEKVLIQAANGTASVRSLKWSPNNKKIAVFIIESTEDLTQATLKLFVCTPDGKSSKLAHSKTVSAS